MFKLDNDDRAILIEQARKAISAKLGVLERWEKIIPAGLLAQPRGAFVTLTIDGNLRGCIGHIDTDEALLNTVISVAKLAAFHDTRFSPVTVDELEKIYIEVSVLEPAHRVDSFHDIIVGEHGVILSKHGRRALFLPQVARDYGWDLETMLTHLSQKAGLTKDDWREDATFEVFGSIKFGEAKT